MCVAAGSLPAAGSDRFGENAVNIWAEVGSRCMVWHGGYGRLWNGTYHMVWYYMV